jgi:hypothetical protein
MDLIQRKTVGEQIDSKSIKKHKNDVFRLFAVLDREEVCPLPVSIQADLKAAFTRMSEDAVELKSLGLRTITLSELLTALAEFYDLKISFD